MSSPTGSNPTTLRHALTTRLGVMGWTFGNLAEIIGVSNAVISRQIRLRNPSPFVLERIAFAVGLPAESMKDLDRQLDAHLQGWQTWTNIVHEGSSKEPQPRPDLRRICAAFGAHYRPSDNDKRWKSPLSETPLQPEVGDVVICEDGTVVICDDPSVFTKPLMVYRDAA